MRTPSLHFRVLEVKSDLELYHFQYLSPLGISLTDLRTGPLSDIEKSCSAHSDRLDQMVRIMKHFSDALFSSHFLSVATIAATKALLSPLLSKFEIQCICHEKTMYEQLSVATCGEWRLGWTPLLLTACVVKGYQINICMSEQVSKKKVLAKFPLLF